jgi:hypothetical protein
MHLLLKAGGLRRSIVMRHNSSTDQREHSQQSLNKTLPGIDDLRISRL